MFTPLAKSRQYLPSEAQTGWLMTASDTISYNTELHIFVISTCSIQSVSNLWGAHWLADDCEFDDEVVAAEIIAAIVQLHLDHL